MTQPPAPAGPSRAPTPAPSGWAWFGVDYAWHYVDRQHRTGCRRFRYYGADLVPAPSTGIFANGPCCVACGRAAYRPQPRRRSRRPC